MTAHKLNFLSIQERVELEWEACSSDSTSSEEVVYAVRSEWLERMRLLSFYFDGFKLYFFRRPPHRWLGLGHPLIGPIQQVFQA